MLPSQTIQYHPDHKTHGYRLTATSSNMFVVTFADDPEDVAEQYYHTDKMYTSGLKSLKDDGHDDYCVNAHVYTHTDAMATELQEMYTHVPDIKAITFRGENHAGARATVVGLRMALCDEKPSDCIVTIETTNSPRCVCPTLAAAVSTMPTLILRRFVTVGQSGIHHPLATFPSCQGRSRHRCISDAMLVFNGPHGGQHVSKPTNVLGDTSSSHRML